MAYMNIECDYCGGKWDVYERNFTDEKNRICPHCRQKIDEGIWNEQILPSFGSFVDMNCDLIRESTGYHTPLFQVHFISDNLFKNRKKKKGKKKK